MIVFPMAGLSSRFAAENYQAPKYRLDLHGRPTFDFAVAGFLEAFAAERFLFVVRDHEAESFVRQRARALGVMDVQVVRTERETAGQAETVEIGVRGSDADLGSPLTIFNIDTFRPGFRRPEFSTRVDGWLEVFVGAGANWSFVAPGDCDRVVATTEKDPISDLCCTGLYAFSRCGDFLAALSRERQRLARSDAELYVAPLYNHLISDGLDIRYRTIRRHEVLFCGVPSEYRALLGDPAALTAFGDLPNE